MDGLSLSRHPSNEGFVTYSAAARAVTFSMPPLEREMEITGPSALKLFGPRRRRTADIFAVLRVFDPDGKEVSFQGALDPKTPIGQGWLRASHRKLDSRRSLPYRPFHTHDEKQPLVPGEVSSSDVEIWPYMHRGAQRLAHPAHRARQGLRSRRRGGFAHQTEEPDARLRSVHPRRSQRPPCVALGGT